MGKKFFVLAMTTVVAGGVIAPAGAHAQTQPIEVWQPSQQNEPDPAKRVPETAPPAPTSEAASQPVASQPYTRAPYAPAPAAEQDRGGFFLGVHGGKGWVFDDVDQSALMVDAGYRWQAGAVTLVGLEVASGQLEDTEQDGRRYAGVDFHSIGANARFNFGRDNPVYGLIRAGYWTADENEFGDSVDGGYVGLGLGADFNRHFNMSVVYTNHVYFTDYGYTNSGDFYYDVNRADTLMLGAEVRF